MINYLFNSELDKDKWDNCIKNSPGVKPYAYSWYLDIMSPGWQALVDDDYDSVFPVTGFKRYGIQYIATPIFLQQLGVFSPDKSALTKINEFLAYIPDLYKLIDLSIGQKTAFPGYSVTEKNNFELDLSQQYEKIKDGFTSDCRRNIQIGTKNNIKLTSDISPEELIGLFISQQGKKLKSVKLRDYDKLKHLMNFCINSKNGKIIGVRTGKMGLISAVFLVLIPGSVTILFTANTIESREMRSGYIVINEIIKEHSSSKTILDFAGSSIPSIASFMKSFGSVNVPYYRIYRNGLFWPARLLKSGLNKAF